MQDALNISQYIIVPEAQDREAFLFKISCPDLVFIILAMLTAVYFNNKHRLSANEISEIGADRKLPPEFIAMEAFRPDGVPENCFCVGLARP